jgi:hypothetical protein
MIGRVVNPHDLPKRDRANGSCRTCQSAKGATGAPWKVKKTRISVKNAPSANELWNGFYSSVGGACPVLPVGPEPYLGSA